MIIAILKETKTQEGRISLTPSQTKILVQSGHQVLIQKNAGILSGFANQDYERSGAKMIATTADLIKKSDLVIKVKEPSFEEVDLMRPGQIFFGYLHLAALPKLIQKILKRKIIALGYETLQLPDGSLPLLVPMSEIAGKLATQVGAHFLRADQGGRGVLLGGTQTVPPAKVLILGGGTVGRNAAKIALGMGGDTTILDISQARLQSLKSELGERGHYGISDVKTIADLVLQTDLLIGSVLICGEKAPKLVSESLVKKMKKGSVIVDVAVDQGGCVATSQVTTHEKPIVIKHGILHYGVANMPGTVPVTATQALTNASFPYIQHLADHGLEETCRLYPEMKSAINCALGQIVHPAIANLKF